MVDVATGVATDRGKREKSAWRLMMNHTTPYFVCHSLYTIHVRFCPGSDYDILAYVSTNSLIIAVSSHKSLPGEAMPGPTDSQRDPN